MARRALAVLLATAVALLLAACGSEDDDTAADPASTTSSSSGSPSEAASSDGADGSGSGSESGSGSCSYESDGTGGPTGDVAPPPAEPTVSGKVRVRLTTSVGDLNAVLDADAAPCTVGSFVSLAEQGFFDESPCHRLTLPASGIAVLQCGDPTGTGRGGPGYTVPDEITGREVYGPGTLAMANTGYPDTGGSQFFIVYADSALQPQYTVFGQVDDASVDLVADVASRGVAGGGVDGAPREPVDIDAVAVR